MILQKYRELLAHELFLDGPVVIFIWKNEPNWPVDGLSANVKRVLGYDKKDFLNKTISYESIVHPEDLNQAAKELMDASRKNQTFFEHSPYRIRKKDGTYIWVHDATTIIKKDDNITHYIGYIIDITKQKNLELELQASNKRWSYAIEGNGDGLWDWNLKTSEVYFSPQWKRMLGFEDDEISASLSEWEKRVHPEDMSDVYKDIQNYLDGKSDHYENEHRVLCKDGSYKWILDRGVAIDKDENGKPTRLIGTHSDITQKKHLSEILAISQKQLANAQKIAKIGSWSLDIKENILHWTDEIFSIFEIEKEKFKPSYEGFLAVIHPEDKEIVQNAFEQSLQNKTPYRITHRLLMNDGRVKFVIEQGVTSYDVDGTPLISEGIVQDITDLKELENLYQKEHKFLENVFDASKVAITAIDRDGTMIEFNKYAQDFTGYSAEEISSAPLFWTVLIPEEIKPHIDAMLESARKGSITHRYENSWIAKNGEERMFEWSNSLIYDDKGEMDYILSIGVDITLQKKLSKKTHDYVKLIDEYIITSSTDIQGNIISTSEAFCRTSGYTKEELLGKNHRILRHPDMPASLYKEFWETIVAGKTWKGEIKNRAKDGTSYWVYNVVTPNFDSKGNITSYTAIKQNITDKKRIEELSIRDSLTGLFNRMKLDEVLKYKLLSANRYDTPLSIVMLDIDYFKRVNDEHGHQAGDTVLKEFAKILKNSAREVDIVGRWGGEEFMIILPQTSLKDTLNVAEKLRKKIENFEFSYVGKKTSSFGVATYIKGESEVQLVERADTALYKAKKNGRNRVES